jgi:hypothetical protein
MANTGTKIVLTLKEMAMPANTPTGNTKNNAIGDPDYIAPYQDLDDCPVVYNTVCPSTILTHSLGSSVLFEFSLPDSSTKNPAVASIVVLLENASNTNIDQVSFGAPFTNFFTGELISGGSGSFTLSIEYRDSGNSVIHNCEDVKSVTI